MALEMTAARMIGNVFSSVNVVWACVIGSILIYLSVGNWLGDVAFQKSSSLRTFSTLILLAGAFTCLIPVISRPALQAGARAMDGLILNWIVLMFFFVIFILAIPVILLGMITPFAIRMSATANPTVETASGKFLAISTAGSFLGTMLPVFILIPKIGSNRTFFLLGALLIIIAFIGFGRMIFSDRLFLVIIIPITGIFAFPASVKMNPAQSFEIESAYNYIEVIEQSGFTYLRLNEGQGIQSIYNPTRDNYYGPWEQILTAPFFQQPSDNHPTIDRAAILGLAGGTSAKQLLKVFPNAVIDGFEIDPEVVKVAKKYFALPDQNLNVFVEDGRLGLQKSQGDYDIVMVDAFQGASLAINMTTLEFFKIASKKLSDHGVLLMNIGHTSPNEPLLKTLSRTAGQVFKYLFTVKVPNSYNTILFAMNLRVL